MTLDSTAYEDEVKTLVETICPRVFVSEIPDALPTPATPYAILTWGEPSRTAGDHHMDSVVNDTMQGVLIVSVRSEDDSSARAVKNRLRAALVGYRPTDCGEFRPEGGMTFSNQAQTPRPAMFIRELYFSFVTNLQYNH